MMGSFKAEKVSFFYFKEGVTAAAAVSNSSTRSLGVIDHLDLAILFSIFETKIVHYVSLKNR